VTYTKIGEISKYRRYKIIGDKHMHWRHTQLQETNTSMSYIHIIGDIHKNMRNTKV